MEYPGFIGGSATTQARSFDSERTVNCYVQVMAGAAKSRATLYPCPGFAVFCVLPESPIRNGYQINGRSFVVAGDGFYEIFAGGSYTHRGAMAADGRVPTFSSNGQNGHQVFISSGNLGYIFDLNSNVLTNVISGSAFGLMLDGYFVSLNTDTSTFAISALEDGTSWDAADVAQRTFAGDTWVAMARSHRELWLFGNQTTEVWYDEGSSPFPFAPFQGAFIEEGCAAPSSVAQFGAEDAGLIWLAQNSRGQGVFRRAEGYVPKRISTEPVEFALSTYANITDAIGYTYQDQGHNFYVCVFPTDKACWVYDDTTGLWHERLEWLTATGDWDAYRATSHWMAFNEHLFGDRSSGAIYRGDVRTLLAMDGAGIRRMRRAPGLSNETNYVAYRRFTLDLEPGLGQTTGQGSDPQVMLRTSNNGGQTWSNERWKSAGQQGQYAARVYWDALGQATNRVFEVTMTDPSPWRIAHAYLETA